MKKVTKEIKQTMKELRSKNLTYKAIAKKLGVASSTVNYHLSSEYRAKAIKRMTKYNSNWEGKKEYQKDYRKKRYAEDPEFRERVKEHSMNYWRKTDRK